MRQFSSRPGYIFLLSVLSIGAIASATTISMILLGLAAQQNGATVVETTQAWEYAQSCVERSLHSLRQDPSYIGEQTITFARGTCQIYSIGGAENVERTICVLGRSGDSVRRVEVKVKRLLPITMIDTWRETDAFTLCS